MENLSPKTKRNLVKLKHSSGYEKSEVLKDLLQSDEGLDQAVEILLSKHDDDIRSTLSQCLAELIAKTGAVDLYEKVKSTFSENDRAHLELYIAEYPDPEIEKYLSGLLYEKLILDKNKYAGVMPSYILKAMRDVGSSDILEDLEAILYDLKPERDVKKLISEITATISGSPPQDLTSIIKSKLPRMEFEVTDEHLGLLIEAIARIKDRSETPPAPETGDLETHSNEHSARIDSDPENEKTGSVSSKNLSEETLLELIKRDETKTVEFKASLSLDVNKYNSSKEYAPKKEKHIEAMVLKTIAGFINSDGGILFVGVRDGGTITGLETEIQILYKQSDDKFKLQLNELIHRSIGSQFIDYHEYFIVTLEGKKVLVINCKASRTNPCFLNSEDFFVRTDPATRKLTGEEMHKYIKEHFERT